LRSNLHLDVGIRLLLIRKATLQLALQDDSRPCKKYTKYIWKSVRIKAERQVTQSLNTKMFKVEKE
jgi:hypothetical protein